MTNGSGNGSGPNKILGLRYSQYFIEIIKQSNYSGIVLSTISNELVIHGAISLVFCNQIKTDINDSTISLSPRIVAAPNAEQF